MRVLFLSYDGMTDPLGRSQVLPYLTGLAKAGHRITLISFEKRDASASASEPVAKLCAEAGISWRPLRYHRRPPILSTIWDVRAMQRLAMQLQRKGGFDLVHCRSYVPALVGLRLKRRVGIRLLFDMRGFWPEERVEGGNWDLGNPLFRMVYRYFKNREVELFQESDAIVSLTSAAQIQMTSRSNAPVVQPHVIPCCADFNHFQIPGADQREAARRELGIAVTATVLCYLGSLGGNYLLDEMLRFFVALREKRPGARFLFVTAEDPASILAAAGRIGVGDDELIIRSADRAQVPYLIGATDFGIAFKNPSFAQLACSPTKLAEMMALGIPMVVNAGVGDVDAIMADSRAGLVIDRFDWQRLTDAVDALLTLNISPHRIRSDAGRWFKLEQGIEAYDAIYQSLADDRPVRRAL